MWSLKGTTLRVIRCPTLQVSQFLFPGQRSDTFLTDHVYIYVILCCVFQILYPQFLVAELANRSVQTVFYFVDVEVAVRGGAVA